MCSAPAPPGHGTSTRRHTRRCARTHSARSPARRAQPCSVDSSRHPYSRTTGSSRRSDSSPPDSSGHRPGHNHPIARKMRWKVRVARQKIILDAAAGPVALYAPVHLLRDGLSGVLFVRGDIPRVKAQLRLLGPHFGMHKRGLKRGKAAIGGSHQPANPPEVPVQPRTVRIIRIRAQRQSADVVVVYVIGIVGVKRVVQLEVPVDAQP